MSESGTWTTRGFAAFRAGTFDNAGQDLYVSRAGILQRLHQMDFNGDGRADLLICNSQDHWESPPCYAYALPGDGNSRQEIPSAGSLDGAVADLNDDGYDDLVLAMDYNGSRTDLNAFVYYGGPGGLGEHRKVELPAPQARAVACGDFNGDGRPDIALACAGGLRVFAQTALGFEPMRFVDLPVPATHLAAADLDGDGYADLYAFSDHGGATIYWGGEAGLDAGRATVVRAPAPPPVVAEKPAVPETEAVQAVGARPTVLRLDGRPHLFVPERQRFLLVPVLAERSLGEPLVCPCVGALAVARGDVTGDGLPDLVVASREEGPDGQRSWLVPGRPEGFAWEAAVALPSHGASDVAVGDVDSDGRAEIVLVQDRTADSFTHYSPVYRLGDDGNPVAVAHLEGHDARRGFIAHTRPGTLPQVLLVNHRARRSGGDVDPVIYFYGPAGFTADNCLPLAGRDCVDALAVDVDDDGVAEIITANCSENAIELDPGSFLFRRGPQGYAYDPALVFPTTRAHGVCCADLNQDGYLDLVFVGFDNPEILFFYGGPEGFDLANPLRLTMDIGDCTYREPRWIYLADLDGDGWLDLFVPQISADRSFILWNGPQGFSPDRHQLLATNRASCAQAADLTGDGTLDLIVGGHTPSPEGPHDSFLEVYWNGPQGLRDDRKTLLPANGINAVAVADFNRDGHLDIFVANYHDARVRDIDSYIYWGQEGGRFSATDRTRLFMHSASGAVALDFNEDGWVDLAAAYHKVYGDHTGHSAVWWNGPEGFREDRVTTLPSLGPHGLMRFGMGNQRDRGPEEYYISTPTELPSGAHLTALTWEAHLPPRTWLRAQVRSAPCRGGLAEAPWTGPAGPASWFATPGPLSQPMPAGPWVQYRLALGATNACGTPRVSAVSWAWET